MVSYRILWYRIVSYRIVSYRTVPYRTVSCRTVSYRTVPRSHWSACGSLLASLKSLESLELYETSLEPREPHLSRVNPLACVRSSGGTWSPRGAPSEPRESLFARLRAGRNDGGGSGVGFWLTCSLYARFMAAIMGRDKRSLMSTTCS